MNQFSTAFRILLLSSLLFAIQSTALGQASATTPAFGAGEELTYTASYSTTVVSTDVASIVLQTSLETIDGISCYKIKGRGTTKPVFSVLFKMDDLYHTWIEQGTLRTVQTTSDIREGDYRYNSRMSFNWRAGLVYTHGKNPQREATRGGTFPLREGDADALTHFYRLRNANLQGLQIGERRHMSLRMIDTIHSIEFRYLGKEIIDKPGIGRVRCMKFRCQLAVGDDKSFKENSNFFIWISDDLNKIPIYLETPVRVGRVYVTLSSWRNLAHPFEAQIKTNR